MVKTFWRVLHLAVVPALTVLPPALYGQTVASAWHAENPAIEQLPNAPSAKESGGAGIAPPGGGSGTFRLAPKYSNTIEPDYQAQKLNAWHKLIFAGTELGSVHFVGGAVIAAGFSHGVDSNPKYGTNREAFAQRVGAAAARGASQIVFSGAILAPILHDDTRYYVMGPGHHVLTRALYAASRVAITRTDGGHRTLNIPALAGYGGSAALTQLYYPDRSRDLQTIASGYGTSLLGLAIQNEVAEFLRFLVRGQPR